MIPILFYINVGDCETSSLSDDDDGLSIGAAVTVAITVVVTFIITLVATSLISVIITRMYYKHLIRKTPTL